MGFKLGKFGRHLAGSIDQLVQGFANRLDYAAEAPPTPGLLSAVALCASVFVVKKFQTSRDKKHQTRSPHPTAVCPAFAVKCCRTCVSMATRRCGGFLLSYLIIVLL